MTSPDTDSTAGAPGPTRASSGAERRLGELTEILERITDAFFALDDEWRFTYVNRQAGRLLQRAPEALLGRSVWEEFPEAVGSTFWREYHRARSGRAPVTFTERYAPLGAWFEVNAYPGAEGLSVYFRDVSERMRFDHLRARQDDVLGAVDVGLWYCDLPFTDLAWDRTVKAHFWLPADARVTIDTFYERIHPEDRERTRAGIERSIETHAPYDIEYRTVAPAEHPDAGRVRWVRAIGYTAYAADGRPVRFDGVTVDVTGQKDAAERLRVSEQRYEYAALATSNAIWDWDFATNRVEWNPGVRSVFGFAENEVEETSAWWYDHIHPEDRERVVTGIHAVIDDHGGPIAWHDEYRYRRADGAHALVVDRGYVSRDASGRATRMIGAMEDVTARREAEAELLRSKERLRLLTAAIPVQVWTAGPDGGLDYVSERAVEFFGAPADELRGDGWARSVHPDDVGAAAARWGAALASGDPYEMEFRLRRHDGAWRWHLARALARPGPDGRPAQWFGSNTDIHDQKMAERARDDALAAADHERARLAELLEQAPAAISMTRGPDHLTVMQNALSRQVAGRDIVGRTAREAFPELVEQGIVDLLDRVYRTGEPFASAELPVHWDRDGDGVPDTSAYFSVVYQPLRDPSGGVSGIISHSVEVTGQVRARQEVEAKAEELARLSESLERSNGELDQFAYVASHDLKAPLRGIANLTEWIEEDLGTRVTGQSAEHMRLLKGRVHRMEALIDGILTYARAARARAQPEPVDAGVLVAEVVDLLAPPAGVVTVAAGMPVVRAERVPLQQVFMNLVSNALKHGRADAPRVAVEWRDAGAAYEFSVSDNGRGIPPAYHERIWGLFQTLEARDRLESTGIGLAVVKKIVESRGGHAWVESEAGHGATFRFSWPKG